MSSEPRESCGLFGVFGVKDAARMTYYGLYAQQHRGEESAGIASTDGRTIISHRGMGLVTDVFDEEDLPRLKNHTAIGHVRYGTAGASGPANAQPLVVDYSHGQIALAHNGTLVGAEAIRDEFEAHGSIFHTTTDTELIIHMLAKPEVVMRDNEGIKDVMSKLRGAFSLLMLTPEQMIAVRDPQGFRPLVLGRVGSQGWAVASETCAFDLVKARYVRDVEPGEIVFIDKDGLHAGKYVGEDQIHPHHCIFELVYFSRPDSRVFGDTVHVARMRMGRELAREYPVEADVVVAVPDSGNDSALGYARESGIPLDHGFIRNHYVGRTFIQPEQSDRIQGVEVKLNVVKPVVKGKRVIVVDDSIIRGTTSRSRVQMLRAAGAKEVHLRISCPPTRHPCFYGIDFPTTAELLAFDKDMDEIRDFLELDSTGYLSMEGMLKSVSQPPDHYCTACWSGEYIVPIGRYAGRFGKRRKR
jgi:amidophosphoribosyltransferase